MGRSKKKSKTPIFVGCCALAALALGVLFFVKKDTIQANLQNTGFVEKVIGIKDMTKPKDATQKELGTISTQSTDSKKIYEEATGSENVKAVKENAKLPAQNNVAPSKESPQSSNNTAPKAATSKMDVTLYFVTVTGDGTVTRTAVKRNIDKSTAPLTATINELLLGPKGNEKNTQCASLIPEGTKLLGASVGNGIATLNFSEEFEFNSMGVDGYIAQLAQVVYTATEFPTVKKVKILIEGNEHEYIGSDGLLPGLRIKEPLGRVSF